MTAVLRSTWRALDYQREVLANDSGIDLLVGGVGAGKSKAAAKKVLRWVARYPRRADGRPTQGLILGKDFRNASGSQFLELRHVAGTLGIPIGKVIADEKGMPAPTITFWNGVTAQAFTGNDPNASRSYEADWLWADEAECMDALSLVTALGRLRAARPVRAIVTSNPSGGGWIWPMLSGESPEWDEIRRANDVRAFRWPSKINPTLDERTLRTMRAAYDAVAPGLSRQELGGRFLGTHEAPSSGPIDFVRAFVPELVLERGLDVAEVVGADLGKSQDFCWFTSMNGAGVALAMDRFHVHTIVVDEKDYWAYVRRRLVEFVARSGARKLVVDGARGGDQFASAIRDDLARIPGLGVVVVDDYATDAPGRRSSLIESVGMAMQLGRVTVPGSWKSPERHDVVQLQEALRVEFAKLKARDLPGGKRQFFHEGGGHDDGVISLGLAWHGLGNRINTGSRDLGSWRSPSSSPAAAPSSVVKPGSSVGRTFGRGEGRVF